MNQLKWYESAAYIRARAGQKSEPPKPWLPFLYLILITGGLFALFRVSALVRGWENPALGFWKELAIAFGIGAGVAFVLPFIMSQATAEIWTNERGLHRKSLADAKTVRVESWPWESFSHCTFETLDFEGARFPELVLHLNNGTTYAIGLDGKIPEVQFEEFLREKGKLRS
jgi:hypothetical protein